MTDYCTAAQVKAYLGTALSTDDALLAALIPRATGVIDAHCKRTFTQSTAETRYFDAVRDVDRRRLYLDDDLLAVTSITNGNGVAVTAGQYVLLPANGVPKYAIELKSSSGIAWTYTTDPEQAITVVGTWGYVASDTPPAAIAHAAVRLVAWYYRQKDAPFETTGMPDLGLVTVPAALPADIKAILDRFVRTTIGSSR